MRFESNFKGFVKTRLYVMGMTSKQLVTALTEKKAKLVNMSVEFKLFARVLMRRTGKGALVDGVWYGALKKLI